MVMMVVIKTLMVMAVEASTGNGVYEKDMLSYSLMIRDNFRN